jgi:hypothetical protein
VAGKLKNLSFESLNIQVLSVERISRVLVQWKLKATSQRLLCAQYFIDRSEDGRSWQQLNADGVPPYGLDEYIDTSANLIDMDKIYYYRVRIVEFDAGKEVQSFSSDSATWEGKLDLVGIYVVDEHLFALRWVYGVPVMIFKKKRDGALCPECWDTVLKRVTKSSCTSCFGTGRLGGYYPPIEAWMSFEPEPKVAQVADWGKRQPSQTDTQFVNYPILSDDDLVLEIKPNKIWKVSAVRYPEKSRTILLQLVRLDAVNQTDIEYKIDVPEDRKRALVAELEARGNVREF